MRSATTRLLVALLILPLAAFAAELPGTWTAKVNGTAYDLTFDSQGGFSIVKDMEAIVVGRYETDDGELTITDLGGKAACQGDKAEGAYRYELSGNSLTLTGMDDPCRSRAAILDGTTFQASGSAG